MKKILSILITLVLCLSLLTPMSVNAAVKISKSKATMEVDSTLKLSVAGTKSTPTWKTSKKAVATVDKNGNISALSEGSTTITATVSGKKYTCSVTVVDSNNPSKILTLSVIEKYLIDNNLISGPKIKMEASMIGAETGVKYTSNNVEIYEFDINSDAYKQIVKTNKIYLKDYDLEFDISAIKGKFVLLCDYADNPDEIIEAFNSIE